MALSSRQKHISLKQKNRTRVEVYNANHCSGGIIWRSLKVHQNVKQIFQTAKHEINYTVWNYTPYGFKWAKQFLFNGKYWVTRTFRQAMIEITFFQSFVDSFFSQVRLATNTWNTCATFAFQCSLKIAYDSTRLIQHNFGFKKKIL